MENIDYKKYRWFFTLSGKLVIGGKSAEQNDELLKRMIKEKQDFIVMHTSSPGSPFSIIYSSIEVTKKDLEECAIFTASFSRAWKEKKNKVTVDMFSLSQLSKSSSIKTGTWAVKGYVEHKQTSLVLVLTTQNKVLRAVPEQSVSKKDRIFKIVPGDTDKIDLVSTIQKEIPNISKEEILSALPAGGIKIEKYRK